MVRSLLTEQCAVVNKIAATYLRRQSVCEVDLQGVEQLIADIDQSI